METKIEVIKFKQEMRRLLRKYDARIIAKPAKNECNKAMATIHISVGNENDIIRKFNEKIELNVLYFNDFNITPEELKLIKEN